MRKEAQACLGVALVVAILVAFWGPGDAATPDSATYVDGARHLARGDGYVSCRTEIDSNELGPIRAWPPGFSALIVPGIWFGLSPLSSARIVLALSFIAASVLVFVLARRVSGPRPVFLPYLAVGLFALQPSQLWVVNRVLSDVPFVPVALLCVYLAVLLVLLKDPGPALKVALGVALVAMVLVRNAGLLMVGAIFVGLFGSIRASSLRGRARALMPVALTFGVLFAPWMIRNKLIGDTAVGRVGLKLTDPVGHTLLAARGAVAWLDDAAAAFGALRWFAWAYVGVTVVLGVVILGAAVKCGWWKSRTGRLLASICVGYFVLMIVTATLHPFNDLDGVRFWVVSWPLGLLFVLFLLRRARLRLPWLHGAAIGGMALTAALYAASFVRELPRADRSGGLLTAELKTLSKLIPSSRRCRLLMNDSRPLLLHRELGPTSELPKSLSDFEGALKANPKLCVAVVGKDVWDPPASRGERVQKKRFRGVPLVESLVESGRLKLVTERRSLRVYEAVHPASASTGR